MTKTETKTISSDKMENSKGEKFILIIKQRGLAYTWVAESAWFGTTESNKEFFTYKGCYNNAIEVMEVES